MRAGAIRPSGEFMGQHFDREKSFKSGSSAPLVPPLAERPDAAPTLAEWLQSLPATVWGWGASAA